MEIEKMLDNVPSCIFEKETLYSALEFEKILHKQKAYSEVENVLVTPFYVDSNKRWRYEMYEYELKIIISDNIAFEDYAKQFFSTARLDEVEKKYMERLKRCFIGAKKSDDILLPLQKYIAFILRGKEIQADYRDYFSGYNAENVFLAVY